MSEGIEFLEIFSLVQDFGTENSSLQHRFEFGWPHIGQLLEGIAKRRYIRVPKINDCPFPNNHCPHPNT